MKNLTAVFFAMAIGCHVFGQQQKGDISIQFSGNYFSQKIEFSGTSTTSSSGNVYLKFGKFLTSKFELGIKPNLSFSPGIDYATGGRGGVDVSLGFGTYATYSFLTEGAKAFPYLGAEINMTPQGKDAEGNTNTTTNVGPYAGMKVFLNERVNLDVGAEYLANISSSYKSADINIGGLFFFNIGIGVVLGKARE
jgi:hypothetical protein